MKKIRIYLLSGIIFLLGSCQNSFFYKKKQLENSTFTVEAAKKIFDKTMLKFNTKAECFPTKPGLATGNFTPFWDKAVITADSLTESVNVPINPKNFYRGFFKVDYADKSPNAKKHKSFIHQKLLIILDKKTGMTDCFIMNIISTRKEYKRYKNISSVRFLNRGKNNRLSGIVLYSLLEDNSTVRINIFKKGQIIAGESVYNKRYSWKENNERMNKLIEGKQVFQFIKSEKDTKINMKIIRETDRMINDSLNKKRTTGKQNFN